MDLLTLLQVLDSTMRLATPLLLACLAGLFSERAGIFDIGLEGKMLAAAFLSAAIAYTSGSAWLGLLAGIGASLGLSSVGHPRACVDYIPWQSTDLWGCGQFPRGWTDGRCGAKLVRTRRAHTTTPRCRAF